jgi:hypothetical protein
MTERSTLSLRVHPHIHPDRGEDIIVEVTRDGKVAATIYGSREGLHIVSDRLGNQPFYVQINGRQSLVIPLLKDGEECPWCLDGVLRVVKTAKGQTAGPCPVCGRE